MTNLVAVYIATNIIRVACTCGWCNVNARIAVPEHINRIGYDLKKIVTTNYLPVINTKSVYSAKGDK